MGTLSNAAVAVQRHSESGTLILEDRRRHRSWRLVPATRLCALRGRHQPLPLAAGTATSPAPGVLHEQFQLDDGVELVYEWRLLADGLEVTLGCPRGAAAVEWASLPGSFAPDAGGLTLALPVMQGVLFDGRGEAFEDRLGYGGHTALSMAMLGYLAPGAGLLAANESVVDWWATVGKPAAGMPYAYVAQSASLGALGDRRTLRLYPTDGEVTVLCKRYRQRVRERGPWRTWTDKVAERPAVGRLFGSLLAFIGYNQDQIDYVEACRGLHAAGFSRAFVYPVRFNTYSDRFLMGGDRPIHLDDGAIAAIRGLGFDVAPWTWVYEALDDGSEGIRASFSRDAAGQVIPNWRIDEYQWYLCCTPFQRDFVRQQYQGSMAAMTWTHFDVNATIGPRECHALDHPAHRGTCLSRAADLAFLRELLGPATNGGRVVSSEGLRDCLADVYDVATTKLLPAWGEDPCWTVPMTMLVYHDVVVHDWWELHNYNASGGFSATSRWGCQRDGSPRHKAAMDALCGCPPNVFPFGRQYRWVDRAACTTESYVVRLDDPPVQEALEAALPVARLHGRTGPQELLSHAFCSEDGAVQRTEFADGTRVFANLGDRARTVPEVGRLDPVSWKAV